MIQRKTKSANSAVIDAISSFLASPPEGTPAEIIEAFDTLGTKELLPPKLFLETVEQAPVAISITDPSAKILYVNEAFEHLTGYARDEIVGKNQSVLSCNSTPLLVYQDLWKSIQNRRVWQGNIVNHRKDKQEYLAELIVSPVLNAQGQITYYLGMHRDITELHQLEQRLKFQKGLTEAAIDSAPMVVVMVASNGKVLFDNHAYKALMGDFRGAEPAELFFAALSQQAGFDFKKLNGSDKGFTNIEVRLDSSCSASPRWFVCSGVRIEKPDETAHNYFKPGKNSRCCLLLIANEVTGSRQRINEARLNMIRANMAETQMVQTMREAISGAIFKLQVPLNIIKAALSMPALGSETEGLRNVLQQALESGDEAMDSLHAALPSPTVEQVSMVNINEILHEVLKLFTDKLLAAGVVVDWRPAVVLPSMTGRANELRGLFKYLLDNSIKALNESTQPYREIRLETKQDQQELVVEIIDNGPGIPETHRLKVFEPFFCGWSQPKGHAGMGLTMAQEVAMGHSGSVEIDGNFYGGCRVFVRLPVNGAGGG
ncbi:MAG: nitrogen fixation negative regulator NifL [Candidatus Thiodiazotropha endolucinida]|nr:nitrogen fixation negative regulator NifL [Candidatus Thiodiazotropha endolucinida]